MIIVANRELIIPKKEQYIGTTYDKNSENRQFLLDRVTAGGVDLANLLFVMDMEYMSGDKNTVQLSKEVLDEKIILTWTLQGSELQVTGTTFINLRAINNTDGKVKWASFRAPIYIEDTIFTPGHYTGDLTELEQIEAAFQLDMERNSDLYDMIKTAYDNGDFIGNGIANIVLNDDYTLTITMDDGTVYHTTSIQGPIGEPGVYVGPAPLPDGYIVWVDTEGETPAPQDGGYYTPAVSEHGIISWEGSNDDMPVLPEQNIKGMRGEQLLWRADYDSTKIYLPFDGVRYDGAAWLCLKECHGVAPVEGEYWSKMVEKGDPGAPRTFSIGTVRTLEAGEEAYVRLTGTEQEPVLNFGLPGGSVTTEMLYDLLPVETVTGNPAVTDVAANAPVKSLVVDVAPDQSGTGDAGPSNVRPMTAKTDLLATNGTDTYEIEDVPSNFISGKWDVVNGVLYYDKQVTFDGSSDEVWTATGDGGYKISIPDSEDSIASLVGTAIVGTSTVGISKIKVYSNIGTFAESGTDEGTIFLMGNELYYYPPATVTTVADFQTWLSNNNMVVSYPVEDPVTEEVDPFEVVTASGANSFATDDGTITVDYRADIQQYIQKYACKCE